MLRDLKECQAEVFRRSEKRIAMAKRRRKQLLITGIPLMVCITVLVSVILPKVEPEMPQQPVDAEFSTALGDEGETKSIFSGAAGVPEGYASCSVACIQVTGMGINEAYTEETDILRIYDQLQSCALYMPEANAGDSQALHSQTVKDVGEDTQSDQIKYSTDGYAITLMMEDGSQEVYWLSENILTDQTWGESFSLTQSQLEALKELLGIAQ